MLKSSYTIEKVMGYYIKKYQIVFPFLHLFGNRLNISYLCTEIKPNGCELSEFRTIRNS